MWHVISFDVTEQNVSMKIEAKKILLIIPIVILMVFTTTVEAQEEENVSVVVDAPEFVSGTFDVTIKIHNVTDLTSGQFDLSFDPNVVRFDDVESGNIDDTEVPIEMRHLVEEGRVRILLKLPGAGLVSGSGDLATINFEVVGNDGDTSDLEISGAELFSYVSRDSTLLGSNTELNEINADWSGDVVTVGDTKAITVKTEQPAETPIRIPPSRASLTSLDSGAGSVTASTPATEHVSDAAIPVGTSERDEPDVWEVLAEHDFIEIYSFIGLLAFAYTLILLR